MIKVEHLYKSYGDIDVLKDISLNIEEGEIYGIIGHSGAGKSTLLRCLNGLETYQKGQVLVNEQDVQSLSSQSLRSLQKNMGMIFQHFNLLNRLNVYDNIALPLKFDHQKTNSPENKEKIYKLLKLVGLEDKVNSFPGQLSGGQKQRVALARALVLDPKILLCDEATSALDPSTTKEILELIKKINEELNVTVVVVTHQMEIIKSLCHKVALIQNGNIVTEGKPEDVFISTKQEIKDFVGEEYVNLPTTGKNFIIHFQSQYANDHIITKMARELNVDFSICQGQLEDYRGNTLGSLVINLKDEDACAIENYLNEKDIVWEEL